MRKEIKDQVFDTEKDIMIYQWWKDKELTSDYNFEILYKNQRGVYYIFEGGGPRTIFGENINDIVTVGSSRIKIISEIEAEVWCLEKILPYDLLEMEV
ncbi:hypothetical protein KQI30_08150 [Clostridium bornimense]|uniref:hypothetical protein n=1 Tax=Clostridium bornimense TaxID=1216932 RepID=UPI001C12462D|nr:hypothetical protein [Clostridium bornimense]MBU5316241.1 hypothetical protein [Clostridium bornimense]